MGSIGLCIMPFLLCLKVCFTIIYIYEASSEKLTAITKVAQPKKLARWPVQYLHLRRERPNSGSFKFPAFQEHAQWGPGYVSSLQKVGNRTRNSGPSEEWWSCTSTGCTSTVFPPPAPGHHLLVLLLLIAVFKLGRGEAAKTPSRLGRFLLRTDTACGCRNHLRPWQGWGPAPALSPVTQPPACGVGAATKEGSNRWARSPLHPQGRTALRTEAGTNLGAPPSHSSIFKCAGGAARQTVGAGKGGGRRKGRYCAGVVSPTGKLRNLWTESAGL